MKHIYTIRFKVLIASIMLVPLLALGVSYSLRAGGEPYAVGAASNAAELDCKSESSSIKVNQCVSWMGSGGNSKTVFVPIGLLAAEIFVAFAVYQSIRRTDRMLLLTKVSILMGTILGSIVVLVLVNDALLPHGQQGIYSADWSDKIKNTSQALPQPSPTPPNPEDTKIDKELLNQSSSSAANNTFHSGYVARNNPTLGYGPEVIDVYMFVSLPPMAALLAGVAIAGATDQRRYAGMRKDALFQ